MNKLFWIENEKGEYLMRVDKGFRDDLFTTKWVKAKKYQSIGTAKSTVTKFLYSNNSYQGKLIIMEVEIKKVHKQHVMWNNLEE